MEPDERGLFDVTVVASRAGDRYSYRVDGGPSA